MTVHRNRIRFATTFDPEFIKFMKFEALKRDMSVNQLIEEAIREKLEREGK